MQVQVGGDEMLKKLMLSHECRIKKKKEEIKVLIGFAAMKVNCSISLFNK